jgi:3-deoxy-D-arabino-heptulosonate 7-phosphate (DAHP) synthase
MIKNPLRPRSIREWVNKAEFVIAGPRHFDDDGQLVAEQSLAQGNDQILLCSRGIESPDPEGPFRFAPYHHWITAARQHYWPPVGVDPSHSAGTMENDLVFKNLQAALPHLPAFVLLEVYFGDGRKPLVDAAQAFPLGRLGEVQQLLAEHNARHY